MSQFKYNIEKEIKTISKSTSGWTKELNLISWNGRDAKYDLRDWAPNKDNIGKGITLSKDEVKILRDTLNKLDLD